MQRLTFVRIPQPEKNIHLQLLWFGNSLGLFGERDKDKSCFRIFIELLKAAKNRSALTSDELAARTKLSRGTIVHHLNKLIDAGMVKMVRNTYALRAETLSLFVEELARDAKITLESLHKIASELDKELGLQ